MSRVYQDRPRGPPEPGGASHGKIQNSITLTMRITSKGQVTIPQEIRERLGLLPHTEVEFAVERGRAVLRPASGKTGRGARIVDHLKTHGAKMRMSSQALLALLRDAPDELDPR